MCLLLTKVCRLSLESKCPATAEFKYLLVKVSDFMACFESGIKVEMPEKSEKLFRAISALDGTNGGTSVSYSPIY